MRHVEHDIQHQLVVGLLPLVKEVELAFQKIEKRREIGVFCAPKTD
jgi:hypothetical protein